MKRKNYSRVLALTVSLIIVITSFTTVGVSAQANENIIYGDAINAIAGEEILVPIKISSNTGLAGFGFKITYDAELLTPIEVQRSGELTQGMLNDSIEVSKTNSFDVIWSGNDNYSSDGSLFVIKFEVNINATGETNIEIFVDSNNTFDEEINEVVLTCSDITVMIQNGIYDSLPQIELNTTDVVVAGEQNSVIGTLTKVYGLKSAKINISHSEIFTFEKIESNVVNVIVSNIVVSENMVTFTISGINESALNTGLFELTFKCSEFASEGEYMFSGSSNNVIDAENIHFLDCKLKISASASSNSAIIKSEKSLLVENGEDLFVPIYIFNNKGIMGYKLTFEYDDSILEPVCIINKNLLSGSLNDNIGVHSEYFSVMWNNTENVSKDGELFNIQFKVLTDTPTSTDIAISYNQADTFDESYEDVAFICNNVIVSINNRINTKPGVSAIIDEQNKLIYGLTPGLNSIDGYFEVADKCCDVIAIANNGKFGTGAVIEVRKDGVTLIKYTIVIFGDVNGDSFYDGADAVIVSCIAKAMLTRQQVGEAVWLAADCNHDNVIDEFDSEILCQAGLLLAEIQQSDAEIQCVSLQSAYENLISQVIEVDKPVEKSENDQTLFSVLIKFFKLVWLLLVKIIFIL